jgi:hypothetical protein
MKRLPLITNGLVVMLLIVILAGCASASPNTSSEGTS